MRRILMLTSLLLLGALIVQGQTRRISGTVTDANDGTPLPGVTVMIQGTTQGTTTDIDGQYEISVSQGDVLVFRFIGMASQEVVVENQQVIDIALLPDVSTLEQVVVTALGIKREERTLTYNVQSVQSDEIISSRQENLVNALQGRVSGVQITSTSGAPGAASEIILRGATSVDGDNQPLFVIDGVPISNATVRGTTNRASDINPNDIESITI
ncbi:MAG: carboxypeptidase-like regulatory domain-containing protein, partial [Bacteroidota bacterium]